MANMAKIEDKLKILPAMPGCYLMKNKDGKAKKLKQRVRQYFVGAHDFKTTRLVSNIDDFEYIVTSSEKEALLLEINLIKKHTPPYNIMFMDDKSYPYLKLTKENAPVLKVVRNTKDRKAYYLGNGKAAESYLSAEKVQADAEKGMSVLSHGTVSGSLHQGH